MKKFLLLFVVAAIMMGCEGPEGPQGPSGSLNNHVQFVVVQPNQWQEYYDEDFPNEVIFSYTFVPEVYTDIFTNRNDRQRNFYDAGSMMAYWYENYDDENERQVPLYRDVKVDFGDWLFVESMSFDYSLNDVRFMIYVNDATAEIKVPMVFRLVSNW